MSRLREGLTKTRKSMSAQLSGLFAGFSSVSDEFYDELEETLIISDLGAGTAAGAVSLLRESVRINKLRDAGGIRAELASILAGLLEIGDNRLKLGTKPSIILVIGVNGVGKTTTIGKLAMKFRDEGKKVMLCAGDTFRAAAGEQLAVWANRASSDIIRRSEGADPASVIFDGINAAKARGADVIICDTAGRLHNKSNLMNELNKISRIIDRELPGSDKETLLVIDATTGQNGLIQAREFNKAAHVSGIVLTKLDGTAKGGIVFAITEQLGVPVKFVGIGEKPEDLVQFDSKEFSEAILT